MKLVRTTREMMFAAELEPCPSCGLRDASKLKYRGSGTNWFLQGPCPRCGTARNIKFQAAEDPLGTKAPQYELGPGPSTWLSAQQLLELFDLTPPIHDPTTVRASDWSDALAALDHARTCINELLKLDTRGSEPRLQRSWLEAERDRLAAVQRAYVAEMPRVSAEQRAAAGPAPRGDMRDASMLAHAQWLTRGRKGEGRLVLERFRATGERLRDPDLTWARLVDCDFTGARFGGALCNHAELEGDVLRGADLDSVPFKEARISGGDWSRAILTRTIFIGASIVGTRFEGADLANAVLDRATIERCDFRDASFATRQRAPAATSAQARFVDCDLRKTDWTKRDLSSTTFVRCKLDGALGTPSATHGLVLEDCGFDVAGFLAQLASS